MQAHTFDRLPGDHASYVLDDPEGAVRLARTARFVGIDTETGSARTAGRWELSAFTVASETTAYVLDPARHREAIKDVLAYARLLVFHSAAYDLPVLVASGLMHPSRIGRVRDTLITARMIWPDARAGDSNSLGALADRVLGPGYAVLKSALEEGWKAITSKAKAAMFGTLTLDTSPAYTAYAAFDPLVTARLYRALPSWLHAALNPSLPGFRAVDSAALDAREQTVNQVLVRRSSLGLAWDTEAAESVITELRTQADDLRLALISSGLDPDRPATELKRAILARLDAQGRVPASWPRLKNGELTTAQTWMNQLAESSPLVKIARDLLQAERWIRDYTEKTNDVWVRGGRVRPQVGVQATITGRMTYGSPNLQQLPGAVRRMYAFDTPATSFDWSSIEPVVAAALARDPAVFGPYEQGMDLYEPVAKRAGVERKTAKTVVLAQLYGQGLASLAFRLNITEDQARTLIRSVRESMPRVTRMIERVSWYGSEHGSIQTISGRRIPLPLDYKNGNRSFMGYKAVNYLVQGSAYDLLSCAIAQMAADGLADELQLAIHDELVVSTSVADDVGWIMSTPPPELVRAAGRVPVLRVGRSDLGMHWEDKA
jgi:DNA polymerase-1